MYTQDTHTAGGANRAHMWGQCPYGIPFKVPALSRYYHDVLPYHYCCIWTNYAYESWCVHGMGVFEEAFLTPHP